MAKYRTLLGEKFDKSIPSASDAISKVLETIEKLCNINKIQVCIDSNQFVQPNDLEQFEYDVFKKIQSHNPSKYSTVEDVHKKFVEIYSGVPFEKIQQMAEHENRMV